MDHFDHFPNQDTNVSLHVRCTVENNPISFHCSESCYFCPTNICFICLHHSDGQKNCLTFLLLTINDWREHRHTFKVWVAHSFVQNQTTNTRRRQSSADKTVSVKRGSCQLVVFQSPADGHGQNDRLPTGLQDFTKRRTATGDDDPDWDEKQPETTHHEG